MWINIKELQSNADPEVVAEAFGIPMEVKANRVSIECPSHYRVLGKRDGRLGNCVLTNHGYHCFACGTTGNVIRMVADYLNMPLDTFEDTLAVAGEIASKCYPEYIEEDGKEFRQKAPARKRPFDLNDQELARLGFHKAVCDDIRYCRDFKVPKDQLPNMVRQIPSGEQNVYLYGFQPSITITDLYQDEDAAPMVEEMIIGKARETFERVKKIKSCFIDGKNVLEYLKGNIKPNMYVAISEMELAAKKVLNAIGEETVTKNIVPQFEL